MNKRFLADIQIIKNAINTNKLVIFAGAGISVDANVPSWSSLIEKIKEELDLPDDEKDYLKITQIYFNDRQEKEYIEKIRSSLGHRKLRYNEIHEELFELNPEHILTTNFEDLLEQVISKNSLPYSIIKEDKDLPYSNNTKLLVKIHGDLERGNLVFKEDDYLGYSHNHPLLISFIKSIFATKVVLFVGYSFNDYNLKQIVQYVKGILGNNFQNAYLLSIDKNIHHSQKQYLKNKGINVINYFDADFLAKEDDTELVKNYVYEFLRQDNIYGSNTSYLKEINSLSEKGQLLLNFLRFIRFYDELKVSINEKNVINQIYRSLKRFEEAKSLPQDFISKLYPFKSSPKQEHLIEYNTILLKNEILVDLFFNKISIENSKIISKEISETDIKKLEFILRKLNNGLIFYVNKESEKPDSLGYIGFSDSKKSIDTHNSKTCNCSKCKFERFQFKESLIEVNSYSIINTTDIQEDMQKAYLNYKFGNYFQAFKMFEEIASKAWDTEKFITYYIAKINILSLKNFINRESQIERQEKEDVLNRIQEIDADKLLFQIPFKSDDEYNLLKIIRDDKILIKVRDKIDEYYNKVLETYKLFQNPYSNSFGTSYPHLIYFELYRMIFFYNENFIINDDFSDFKQIINKAVEALLINYATSSRYNGRIKEFDIDFFELITPYLDSEKFIKTLDQYNIEEIKFNKDNLDNVLQYSKNFFDSYFEKNRLFDRENKSEIIEIQLQKDSFKEKTKVTFNNIILFLSQIELNKNQFELIKTSIFSFLTFEKQLFGNSIKYLKFFLSRNYKNITKDDCKKMLGLVINKLYKYDRHEIIRLISEISFENNLEIIDDLEYAKRILLDVEYDSRNYDTIVYLWLLSNQEIRNYYYEKIIRKLENNFDIGLYKKASLYKIIDYNDFFDSFLNFLNNDNKNNNLKEEGYFIEENKPKYHDFQFHNNLLFLYNIGVKSTDKRLEKLTNLHEFMKFGIFREKFDFSKFKIEWLYLFDYETFYKEFKKIKPLKKIIENSLKENYDEELAKIYTHYFL